MRAAIRCCHSDVDVVIHKAPPPLFHVHIKRIENIHTHSFDAAGRYYMYKEEKKKGVRQVLGPHAQLKAMLLANNRLPPFFLPLLK